MSNKENKVWVSGVKKPTEINEMPSALNKLLWLVIIALAVAGVVLNNYLPGIDHSSSVTTAGVIVAIVILLFLAKLTNQGRKAWAFINASRLELRKVVWPTRQETINSTLIVLAIVIVASLIIYFVGLLFMTIISAILG